MRTILPLLFFTAFLEAQSLTGIVDVHAHSDPDSMPRSIDAIDLAKLAQSRGMRALVLKNHFEPTASLAYTVRKVVPGIEVFGGIVLNRPVGGINIAAVERMAANKGGWGRVVWMPTFDSENQVRKSNENRPFVRISSAGKLLPEVQELLAAVAKHKLVLATGHSSPDEVLMLVQSAKVAGIQQVLVTHATLGPVMMTLNQMKKAAKTGAYIEFVGNAVIGNTKVFEFADYAAAIRAIGPERCILSSDLGQAGNPTHPEGLQQILSGLTRAGLNSADLRMIAVTNPSRLLGLPEK
jgi:hypothetical protein